MDLVCLGCCILAFLLYYNTLDAGFVYDDRRAILSNPDLLPSAPLSKLLENDFWGTPLNDSGSHGSYRPLCTLSYRLNYLLGGFQPWGYHLVNILLHVLATGLFVRVSRCILPRRTKNRQETVAPAVAGTFFAVHPVHTEAVASIVGRADLAACNLFLLAILCYVKHVRCRDYRRYVRSFDREHKHDKHGFLKNPEDVRWWNVDVEETLSLLGCILFSTAALFAKETGITVLAVCVVYDLSRSGQQFLRSRRQIRSVSLLVLTALTLILLRLQITSGHRTQFSVSDNPAARASSVLTRFLTFVYLPVFNFLLLLYPNQLSFDWGMDAVPRITTVCDARNVLSVTFYAALVLAAKRGVQDLLRQNSAIAVVQSKTNSVCQNAFELNNNNNNNQSVRSCCPRIASLGRTKRTITVKKRANVLLVTLALLVFPFLPATNLFFYVGFVVAERILYIPSTGLCLLLGLGVSRLWSGRLKVPLFAALVFTLVWFSVRTVTRNKDWLDEESLYKSAVDVNPAKAYGNLGTVLSTQGRNDEAEWAFRKALQNRRNMADVHYNLGVVLHKKGQLLEAISCFQSAISYRPTLALAYLNLGVAFADLGRCQEAISVLRQGAQIDGIGLRDIREHENARISVLLQLGTLYAEQGRLQRALAVYREAVHSLPKHYPPQKVYNVLGETLTKLKQFVEAEHWFLAALNAAPTHVPAHLTYGKLLAKNSSRLMEAEQWFRRAQKLAPDDASVHHHYGEFLRTAGRFQEAACAAEKAAELRPEDFELTVVAAETFRQSQRLDDAEFWYRRAVQLKPLDSRSHTNLGAILHLNSKYKEAVISYKAALKIQPNDKTTMMNLNKLRSLMYTRR